MAQEQWTQIKKIFLEAMHEPCGQRAAFLDSVCSDTDLRREVEALLSSFDSAEGFLESPLSELKGLSDRTGRELKNGEIFGHYNIIRQIGVGGMGEVYEADDLILKRKVALKLVPENIQVGSKKLPGFEREAQAASALNHPNILTVYEIGVEDEYHFIATEFIEGESLRQRLVRGRINTDDSLDITIQIASALLAAHEHGIIHRDIKPENIMLRPDGIVKVLDFGLAKNVLSCYSDVPNVDSKSPTRNLASTGLILGTPQYMSPEQARGQSTDARTDIWSLGCVLYEMLSGRSPFASDSDGDAIAAILTSEPQPLARIPEKLRLTIEKCLCKNRAERHQNITDLLSELKVVKADLEFAAKLGEPGLQREAELSKDIQNGIVKNKDGLPADSGYQLFGQFDRYGLVAVVASLIFIVAAATLSSSYFINLPRNPAGIDSIAVLPFQNETGDSEMDYISDGVAESLINSLTQVQDLHVIARTTAFRYKDKEIDLESIARQLAVKTVLTGRVRRIGARISIQVDLVEVSTGSQLWGEEFDQPMSDLLIVKQLIIQAVVKKLNLELSSEDKQRLVKSDSQNSQAYRHYIRGRFLWDKGRAEENSKAIKEFNQAIELDPNFALAYVGLAEAYNIEGSLGPPQPNVEQQARAALERALQIDPFLSEAHASLAGYALRSWNFAQAEAELKRAIELNPNYPRARARYSTFLRARGQMEEARAQILAARSLDPLSTFMGFNLAQFYLYSGELDKAIEAANDLEQLDPNFPGSHWILGVAFRRMGQIDDAVAEFEKSGTLGGRRALILVQLSVCHAAKAKTDRPRSYLRDLETLYIQGQASGRDIAAVLAVLGEKDKAFEWLEKDFQERRADLPGIAHDPAADVLRNNLQADPRWIDLLRRIGWSDV